MYVKRTAVVLGLLVGILLGSSALPAQAHAAPQPAPITDSQVAADPIEVNYGPCSLAALGPLKHVGNPSWMEAYSVFWCDNNLPRTCTFHVYLQIWDFYYKTWVNISGKDRWWYGCPGSVGARKNMYSYGYNCSRPEYLFDFRTVVYGSVTWPNGTVENRTSTGNRYTYYC